MRAAAVNVLARLAEYVNHDPVLRRRGRFLDADMLLEIGTAQWLMTIRDGQILQMRTASPVMNSWTFAMRFDAVAWELFLTRLPPPGTHDLMALLRTGRLRLEGNLHPFMSHLLWFKEAFATLRDAP